MPLIYLGYRLFSVDFFYFGRVGVHYFGDEQQNHLFLAMDMVTGCVFFFFLGFVFIH